MDIMDIGAPSGAPRVTPAPLSLGFDTSASNCCAAVMHGPTLLASCSVDMARGQAEHLMPLLQDILGDAGKTWRDLDVIGVGIGPGNFTGIRISVAAARGLALSLGVPAIGVSTLEAMGLDAGPSLCAISGPAGSIYWQFANEPPKQSAADDITLPHGHAQVAVIDTSSQNLAQRTGGRPVAPKFPLAEAIARLAIQRLDTPDLQRPAPLYIRAANAAPAKDAPPVLLD